jgi:uncharacterized protein
MATYKTPGVYVEEISTLPPSVAEVETAIPAFIGFTQKGILNTPKRISSLKEYEDFFGGADPEKGISIILEQRDKDGEQLTNDDLKDPLVKKFDYLTDVLVKKHSNNVIYYALQLYYANGGGPCYIISAGTYSESGAANLDTYTKAIDASSREDEPTLLVFPDAPFWLASEGYYSVINYAIKEATRLGDRFVIVDVIVDGDMLTSVQRFRDAVVSSEAVQLKYSAAYFPYLNTNLSYEYDEKDDSTFDVFFPSSKENAALLADKSTKTKEARDKANAGSSAAAGLKRKADRIAAADPGKKDADDAAVKAATEAAALDTEATKLEAELKKMEADSASAKKYKDLTDKAKNDIKKKIGELGIQLTPCAAIAGVYASVDNARGVWKAPANVGLSFVNSTNLSITHDDQKDLNVDVNAGKSINAIRPFIGKGVVVWGARTLNGNSNEWRYINVRRFFNMVEESVKKSTYWAVFESNDINTWIKVRAMIENYLILKWKDGALAGAKPDDAFYVRVGLGQTMSPQDVLEGRMIVEIGLAAVRPAEFIILKFSHKLQTS